MVLLATDNDLGSVVPHGHVAQSPFTLNPQALSHDVNLARILGGLQNTYYLRADPRFQPLALPADAETGRFLVYFALLDPYTLAPAIKLAVDGRDAQGWYSWSAVSIAGKGKLEETLTKTP